MVGGHDRNPQTFDIDEPAPLFGKPECRANQQLASGRSQGDDQSWLDEVELKVEPWPAGSDLMLIGPIMETPLAAGTPLEMLDDVRDEDALAIDPGLGQRAIQDRSRGAHEWVPGEIFPIAGLLSDEHQCGTVGAFAEDGLSRVLEQVARRTAKGEATRLSEISHLPSAGNGGRRVSLHREASAGSKSRGRRLSVRWTLSAICFQVPCGVEGRLAASGREVY
jgi:hypothetical protein